MTWDLEEAGDDAVTLHREDGLVLSATRVADDAGTPNRAHPWTEWRFSVTDGDTGERLTEHGWEIVDEEHLWEVLDGFTYRFERETAEAPADESATATTDTAPADAEIEDGSADGPTEPADETPDTADDDSTTDDDPDDGSATDDAPDDDSAVDDAAAAERTDRPAASANGDASAADSTAPAAGAEPTADPKSDSAGAERADSERRAGRVVRSDAGAAVTGAATTPADGGEPTDDREREGDPTAADRAAAHAPSEADSESVQSASSTERGTGRDAAPDVTYRPARPADADELAAVYRSAYAENRELGFPASAESATADDVREWIEADGMLVAVADDDVVAGVRLEETDPSRVKVSRLAVREDFTRRGIGSALLDRAEAAVDAGRADTVWLTTPADHPYLADMYRGRGYERTGAHPLEDREYDEIVMEKRLP